MTSKRPASPGLYAVLYPFTTAAVAINLFMLALMWQAVGLPALRPVTALVIAVPLGLPVNWLAMRWVLHLIDEAEGDA
jgi:hypothetical protein